MKRRDFFKITTPLAASPFLLNGVPLKAFDTSHLLQDVNCDGIEDRVIVLIELNGGNDGFNTLVQMDQYDIYANLRPNLRIPENAVIPLDTTLAVPDQVGLHPAMTNFKSLYDEGKVNIVRAVSYDTPTLSHFKGMHIWAMGGDGTPENSSYQTGWMGRYLESVYPDIENIPQNLLPDPLGIQVGFGVPSTGFLTSVNYPISVNMSGQNPSNYFTLVSEVGGAPPSNIPMSQYGQELAYLAEIERSTNRYSARITEVFEQGTNTIQYSQNNLANQLKTVARLLSGGSKTKVFMVRFGGFDTHHAQVTASDTTVGAHADLLAKLSDSVKAFMDDLVGLGLDDKVLAVTVSEFGRRAYQNGSLGTDHGSLAPMFVFGKGVEPGIVGTNPNLNNLDSNGLVANPQHDYRQVLTTILQDWLGSADEVVEDTFWGDFLSQKLPIINENHIVEPSCYISDLTPTGMMTALNNDADVEDKIGADVKLFPNPAKDFFYIEMTAEEMSEGTFYLFNSLGQAIKTLKLHIEPGRNKIPINIRNIAAGIYTVQMMADGVPLFTKQQVIVSE